MFLGLSITAWLDLIRGVLAFPDSILKIVKLLQATPEEKHDELLSKMAIEAEKFKDTNRPTWG